MAIDPMIAAKAASEFADVAKETIKVLGETSRGNKKSEEETKQKEIQEKNETDRRKTEDEQKTQQIEIKAHHETEQKKNEEREKTEREKTTANKKTREKELDNNRSILEKGMDVAKEVQNEYKDIIGKKDKELAASKAEIKEYQKSLMFAYGEVQRYKAVEESRNIFAKNITNYVEKKAKFDEEIKNLNYDVDVKEKELHPLEMDLNTIETSIISLQDAYDDLGRRFEVVVKSMSDLKFEHKGDLDPQKYREKYGRKKRELIELIDDISNKELQLLKKEKERLDKIKEIEPLLIELKRTKKVKDILEISKENFLNIGILKLPNLQSENKNIDKSNTENIIDVDVSDSKKLIR